MAAMQIEVLRLSHRLPRDERISTHVALVARAFGASAIAYTGQHDAGFELSVSRICEKWGGRTVSGSVFSVSYEKSAVSFIKARKRAGFTIVHLTMYGLPLPDVLPAVNGIEKLLIIVGSEHVPGEIYALADHNVSVTAQPHSEVAALAIVLDRLMGGRELGAGNNDSGFDFKGKARIVPSARGKRFADANAGPGQG
ncbi:tRNA (cytidine(56)-2'-O)-methyltransferase [Candidatus Micrarchaeota archaeon]|nr:tRNA (cytidine(56)-2'-O)-methyltransferase [Candidatus Micrarchaeota archaeon]